jgi:hypothetical protein
VKLQDAHGRQLADINRRRQEGAPTAVIKRAMRNADCEYNRVEARIQRFYGNDAGIVYAFGMDDVEQLGRPEDHDDDFHLPRTVKGLPKGVRSICAGGSHSVALTVTGEPYTWFVSLICCMFRHDMCSSKLRSHILFAPSATAI